MKFSSLSQIPSKEQSPRKERKEIAKGKKNSKREWSFLQRPSSSSQIPLKTLSPIDAGEQSGGNSVFFKILKWNLYLIGEENEKNQRI